MKTNLSTRSLLLLLCLIIGMVIAVPALAAAGRSLHPRLVRLQQRRRIIERRRLPAQQHNRSIDGWNAERRVLPNQCGLLAGDR